MSVAVGKRTSTKRLLQVAQVAVALLLAKVLLAILYEYRLYFPADFEAAFLSGRKHTFFGCYRIAFYTHIISSPLSIVFAVALMWSGQLSRLPRWHRVLGRLQVACVVLFVAPSGFVMAMQAYAGPIAGWGFALQAVVTATAALAATWFALKGKVAAHRRWATRCTLLLISPLLLRVISGVAIVTSNETDLFFRLNAWLSWIMPLVCYEFWMRREWIRGEMFLKQKEGLR